MADYMYFRAYQVGGSTVDYYRVERDGLGGTSVRWLRDGLWVSTILDDVVMLETLADLRRDANQRGRLLDEIRADEVPDTRTCAHPGEPEHDHALCEDVVAEDAEHAHDGTERWELQVTVPPVTVETQKVHVRCGQVLVIVERRGSDAAWEANERGGSYRRGPARDEMDVAVADARRIAEESERHRLLIHALHEALVAESTQDGEARA